MLSKVKRFIQEIRVGPFAAVLLAGLMFALSSIVATRASQPPFPTGPNFQVYPLGYCSTCTPTYIPFALDSSGELMISGGGGGSLAPFTGGATSVAFATGQGIALFASNGTTEDALQEGSGALFTSLQTALPAGTNIIGKEVPQWQISGAAGTYGSPPLGDSEVVYIGTTSGVHDLIPTNANSRRIIITHLFVETWGATTISTNFDVNNTCTNISGPTVNTVDEWSGVPQYSVSEGNGDGPVDIIGGNGLGAAGDSFCVYSTTSSVSYSIKVIYTVQP